jgi:hypothetical protein
VRFPVARWIEARRLPSLNQKRFKDRAPGGTQATESSKVHIILPNGDVAIFDIYSIDLPHAHFVELGLGIPAKKSESTETGITPESWSPFLSSLLLPLDAMPITL